MESYIEIDFQGDKIIALVKDGTPYVALRPICETLKLGWSQQLRTLKNDIVLSTCVTSIVTQVGKQKRKMIFLPIDYFQGWMFKINAKNYKGERQERLIAYQRECYRALHGYFNHGGAINPDAASFQLRILQAQIEDYKKYLPADPRGTFSCISGRKRIFPVRSYFRALARKPHEMTPDLFPSEETTSW